MYHRIGDYKTGFTYTYENGKIINKKYILNWIKSLKIPPAYNNVKISNNQLTNNYPESISKKNDGKSNNYNISYLLTTSQKEKKKNFANMYNNNIMNKYILSNANKNNIFNSNNHSKIFQDKNYILSHKYYASSTNHDVLMNIKADPKNNIIKKKTKNN